MSHKYSDPYKETSALAHMAVFVCWLILWVTAIDLTLMFVGCASIPQAKSDYVIVHALPVQKGDAGLYFAAGDMHYMTTEGVPASLFTLTPRGYYLTRLQVIEAGNDVDNFHNPAVK